MKLPNFASALVEREKIEGYLLNIQHPFGSSKARFFIHFGFGLERWEELADALLEHGQTHDVTNRHETHFGPRYEVAGALRCPSGRRPQVRTVWQMDNGAVAPRLITAYPLAAQ